MLEIDEASPVRTACFCPFYTQCGGCNLQHIEYNAQLEAKVSILTESFKKIGDFDPIQPDVYPCVPAGYRNRMQFHCLREKAKDDNLMFGLKGRRTNEIIAVSDCPVAHEGIREILKGNGKKIPVPPEKDRFTVFSHDGLLLSEGGMERGKINLLEKEITLDAGIFFQSNIVMLEKLIIELRKIAQSADRYLPMMDLYCGVGTFAVFLAERFPKAVLAEEKKQGVSLAKENLKKTNCEFFALRDTEWEKIILRKEKIGFAIVDPPRAGLNQKLSFAFAKDGPPVLAYVSCDASALARDSKILINGGYKLKELKLFDFYPQTAHIETLAVFNK